MPRYEDLVAKPLESVCRMLEFLGLDSGKYDWASLEAGRVSTNSSYVEGVSAQAVLGQGVSRSSIGRYRDVLSSYDVFAVERLLGGMLDFYGYVWE